MELYKQAIANFINQDFVSNKIEQFSFPSNIEQLRDSLGHFYKRQSKHKNTKYVR